MEKGLSKTLESVAAIKRQFNRLSPQDRKVFTEIAVAQTARAKLDLEAGDDSQNYTYATLGMMLVPALTILLENARLKKKRSKLR